MKTLQDVAKAFKQAAGRAIYPGVSYSGYKGNTSKAFKTGNLLTSFVTDPFNQPNQIGQKTQTGFQLVLQVGPGKAPYGTYVHYGTYKMKSRPFAELATDDRNFQSVLNEFLGETIDEEILERMCTMDSEWEQAGFTIT